MYKARPQAAGTNDVLKNAIVVLFALYNFASDELAENYDDVMKSYPFGICENTLRLTGMRKI